VIRRPALLLLVVVLAACGASSRTKALRAAHISVNVTRDTVLEVSRTRETQIVDACNPPSCTLEQGRAQLAAWRGKVDDVVGKLATAYRLLAAAALGSDAESASEAIKAVKLAVDAAGGLQ
jgi:hypothetical protein